MFGDAARVSPLHMHIYKYNNVGNDSFLLVLGRAAFTAWLLMNILLMVVPRYGAYTMVLTGVLVLGADLMYLWLLPDAPLQVRFEVGMLKFELGWCFWLTLVAGKQSTHSHTSFSLSTRTSSSIVE